jgi:hypothetical protein
MKTKVSKPVGDYEVCQHENRVSVRYGGPYEIFGWRSFRSIAAATRAYNQLEKVEDILAFSRENPVD